MSNSFTNPLPTVDIIIEINDGHVVLIKRSNPPIGWALPGGFVEYGESYEECAIREAFEETCLDINLKEQFHTYSDPMRDHRQHTTTTVFIATAKGFPEASSDAKEVATFIMGNIPDTLAFDHNQILSDYFDYTGGMDKNKIFEKYL